MRNLYLDEDTYDLVVTPSFNLKFTTTLIEYVSQKLENALKTFKDEWYLNRSLGIPYFEKVLVKNPDINDVNSLFRGTIDNISEVLEILEFTTAFDTASRKYTVDFTVLAGDNETEGTVVEGEIVL